MGKIIKLSQIKKFIHPNTATLVGGSFDLFHVGHLRYLKKAGNFGRPLIVVLQSDKVVFARKGFGRPIVHQNQRAELVSALECVDYVLVLDKPSHYDGYLERFRPKCLVFYKENFIYRKRRAEEIAKKFPDIKVVFVEDKKITSTTNIIRRINYKPDFSSIHDPLKRRLHELAMESTSKSGKVSAILLKDGKIIKESNNDKFDRHAEKLILDQIRKSKILLENCELYVLIPPCIMCAELILKSDIKRVYYLYSYGNDDGLKLLRDNGVHVKKIR